MSLSIAAILSTILAGVASLGGVILALTQFTASARMKSQAARWREEISQAELAHDKAIFISLHRDAVAKGIAIKCVPNTGLLFPYALILFSLGSFVVFGIDIGKVDPATLTWSGAQEATGDLLSKGLAGFLVLLVLYASNTLMGIFWLRRSLVQDYLAGRPIKLVVPALKMFPPIKVPIAWKALGVAKRLVVQAVFSIALCTFAFGSSYSTSTALAANLAANKDLPFSGVAALGPLAAGVMAAMGALAMTGDKAFQVLQLPRPLTTAAARPSAQSSAFSLRERGGAGARLAKRRPSVSARLRRRSGRGRES